MKIDLGPKSFILADESADRSAFLREAVATKTLKRFMSFVGYLASRSDLNEYTSVANIILTSDQDKLKNICKSPVFRAWFQLVGKENNWEIITPRKEALLTQMASFIFSPYEPQSYFTNRKIRLWSGARFMPPDLEWGWMGLRAEKEVPADLLSKASELAAELEPGTTQSVTIDNVDGVVSRSIQISNKTIISNFHPLLKVHLTGTNQRNTGIDPYQIDWNTYPDKWASEPYIEGFQLLEEAWPEEFADHLEVVMAVVPMLFEKRSRSVAFSVSSHQGAIFVTPRDPRRMIEMLIHEKAHIKQRYVDEIWPLLEPEQTNERFSVSWRPDPRPIYGIFEGIYVFLQVGIGLKRYQALGIENIMNRLEDLKMHLADAITLVGREANMTPAGREFYMGVQDAFDNLGSR